MNSTVYSLMLCFLAVLVLGQELADEPSSAMDKRYRQFAFAKRFAFNDGPSRAFAFAKRSNPESALDEQYDPVEEKRARFAFAKKSMRNFAFAKRSPYASFA
uniref:CRE-FLP-11 protein n=1 Tax=Panagrellus redivivus TaxID=6233 RepID=A0A7E5A0D7_PANRE